MRATSPAIRPSRIWPLAVALVLAGALVYANSLSGPFLFDDQLTILENRQIQTLFSTGVLFAEREAPVAGRPLVNITFAINYAIGRLDVVGYHVLNVAIHLLAALVLFGVVRRTLGLPASREWLRNRSAPLAFVVALIWVVHPLNTEAVDYLTQRTESMMGLFYFLTLYASIRARTAPRVALWTVGAVLACAGGMACKESMVTAPVMVVVYDRVFFFDSLREAWRRRWPLYAGMALTWLELAALVSTGPRVHSAGFSAGVDSWTYLLNQAGMIVTYLWLAVWPRALVLNYGAPEPLTLADVVLPGSIVGALLALTIVGLIKHPKIGFLGAWFFVTLAPASSIVPVVTEVGAERRMYVPLAAVIALIVAGAALLWERLETGRFGHGAQQPSSHWPAGAMVLVALAAFALGARTTARNREYSSGVSIARTVLERRPSGVAHMMLGTELTAAGQPEEGVLHLREATRTEPKAHYNLGVELYREGKIDEAMEQLQQFVTRQPMLLEVVAARTTMGRMAASQRNWSRAIEEYRQVLKMAPSNVEVRGLLAEALAGQESFDDAISAYQEYLRYRPNHADAWTRLGIASASAGKPAEAVTAFRRAVELQPGEWEGHRNLANALIETAAFDEAASHAQEALRGKPDDAVSHELLGLALAGQGNFVEARVELERSLRLNPADTNVRDELDRLIRAGRASPAGGARP